MEIKRLTLGELVTNCYLIYCGDESAIIDPGAELNKVLEAIKKSKTKLKYIIATHWHPDHTTCCEDLRAKSGAQLLIHRLEKDYVDFAPDKLLESNDVIKIGKESLKVLHTPGHTKGGICLLGDKILFTGDLLFVDGYGRTDLPGGDDGQMQKSLEFISGVIKPGYKIYPGHGETFEALK